MVGHASQMLRPGDPALLRHVFRGHVMAAAPVIVVEDSPARVVTWMQAGTPIRWIARAPMPAWIEGGHGTVAKEWDDNDVIGIHPTGRAHAVQLLREAATGNEACWYVNLQEPLRRTPLGWDTCDQELDVVAWPDLSEWFWKDEEQFEERIRLGLLGAEEGAAVRKEALDVIADLETRRGTFAEADAWRAWKPPPSWPIPQLPDGWDVL
jgi:predicted RNA-binding protein associated with RNAse of E/G family